MYRLAAILCTATLCCVFFYSCKKDLGDEQEVPLLTSAAVTTGPWECSTNALTEDVWQIRFEDHFNSDLNNWTIWEGGAYNYELQLYQADNLVLSNGILKIEARKETKTGSTLPHDDTPHTFAYTSGRIESKTHFSANNTTPKVRMSARIKLPNGYGMWPAFWSYGDPWPTQGEIDILEAKGQEPYIYHTAYWYGRRSGKNTARNTEATIQAACNLQSDFHIYEVVWEKNSLSFYFDGHLVNVKSGGDIPNFYRKSQRVTLNLAVGGLFFGSSFDPAQIQTGTMEIDWVKVYTAK